MMGLAEAPACSVSISAAVDQQLFDVRHVVDGRTHDRSAAPKSAPPISRSRSAGDVRREGHATRREGIQTSRFTAPA